MHNNPLGKRERSQYNEPKHKKRNDLPHYALANLQRLARANMAMTEELENYFHERPGSADDKGNTLLHYAVMYHNEKLLNQLLDNELLDSNAVNLSGETPLICAVGANNVLATHILLGRNPELTSVYEAFDLAHIINNPKIINVLEEFLISSSNTINWHMVWRSSELDKINKINQQRFAHAAQFQRYLELKNAISAMPDFFWRLTREFDERRLDQHWFENFEPELAKRIAEFIRDRKNFPAFINFFSAEQKKQYFYIFLELFFGADKATEALIALGPRQMMDAFGGATLAVEEDETEIITDELIELLKLSPALAAKITRNYFHDRKFESLKKIFSKMPWWFINIEELNSKDLLRKTLSSSLFKNERFLKLLMQHYAFNINRSFVYNNENIIKYALLVDVNIDIFRLFLEYEPNINQKNSSGTTILMNAIGKKQYFKEILNHEPDLMLTNPIGMTALKIAIISNDAFAVKLLLDKISNNSSVKNYYYTQKNLYIAAAKENLLHHNSKKNENLNSVNICKAQMIFDAINSFYVVRTVVRNIWEPFCHESHD